MKYIIYFQLLQISITGFSQQHYLLKTIKMPASGSIHSSFYVNELNQVFIPLNGGIYVPKDTSWFIKPDGRYYFTSFAPNIQDTGIFVISAQEKNSELFYLKSSLVSGIQKTKFLSLQQGIYELIADKNIFYIWGYDSISSKIGIITRKEVKWIFSTKGFIAQVHINNDSLYFALGNGVYNLKSMQKTVMSDSRITGFAFDAENNLVISTEKGTGIKKGNVLNLILPGISGLVQIQKNNIYVLPPKGTSLFWISY